MQIFCKFFANISQNSQNFRKFFANFLQIFRDRPREESVSSWALDPLIDGFLVKYIKKGSGTQKLTFH